MNPRRLGRTFELKVRRILEDEGWFVSKWCMNVLNGRLVIAKHKFNPFTKVMYIGTGFPDFIAFKRNGNLYNIIGVEAKKSKYLCSDEKEKGAWLLSRGVFEDIRVYYQNRQRNIHFYSIKLKGGE